MGMGTYGRGFRLVSNEDTGMGAPASGPSTAGPYTREAGFLSYYEVMILLSLYHHFHVHLLLKVEHFQFGNKL